MSPALANLIIVIVTAVWVTSFVVALMSTTYKPDPQINVIFMAVVGGAMALKARKPAGTEEKKP
jgi:hypothetical protein